MAMLKLKVRCFHCGKEVEKLETRPVEGVTKEVRYECFPCFKKHAPRKMGNEKGEKKSYYCERCRYQFYSHTALCPYCSKSDLLESGTLTVHDLLK